MTDYYYQKLQEIKQDEDQWKAYTSTGSAVVLAGPGSGKTTVLTLKLVKALLEDVREPRSLACLTFSREAAREFSDRLRKYGFKKPARTFMGTIHAFCMKHILAPNAHLFPQYRIPTPIQLIPDREKQRLFLNIRRKLMGDVEYPRIVEMDQARKVNIPGSSYQVDFDPDAFRIGEEFEAQLLALQILDFELVVKLSTLLIQNEEFVRKSLVSQFPILLIDEYQDLGKPLHEMVLSLKELTNIRIFAVGDPDQSIYSFQGAFPEFLLELTARDDFETIRLKKNYRSNQGIVDVSAVGLGQSRNYVAATRLDQQPNFAIITCDHEYESQFEAIAQKIIPYYQEKGLPLEEIAIFLPGGKEVTRLAEVLGTNNIPYYVPRREFERTEVVKWLEECAAYLTNPDTLSFKELFEFYLTLWRQHQSPNLDETEQMILKRKLLSVLEGSKTHLNSAILWINYFLDELKFQELLHGSALYPDEVGNLGILLTVMRKPEFASNSVADVAKWGKPKGCVTVTTRHGSKGLEFEVVILPGMDEKKWPSWSMINHGSESKKQEDRRIFFVCLSRAKRAVLFLRSKTYNAPTKDKKDIWSASHKRSSYLEEIIQSLGPALSWFMYP